MNNDRTGGMVEGIDKITMIGMGALGVLYGDFLAEKLGAEAVTFLADAARTERYRREGVFCNGRRCKFRIRDSAAVKEKAQLLIFAVKATALEAAIEAAIPHIDQNTIIFSVLNGITSEEIIGRRVGAQHLLYCIAQGMDAVKSGNQLSYTNLGTLCLGIPAGRPNQQPKLKQVAALFEKAGLPFVIEPDIRHRLWSKWMLNVGVNQVVMVFAGTYGTVQQQGAARDLMIAAMEEAMLVAGSEGVPLTRYDLEGYVDLIDTLNPEGMPSMRQDGLARRYSEVELFAGTVIAKARQYHLEVPVNEGLYRAIQAIEAQY